MMRFNFDDPDKACGYLRDHLVPRDGVVDKTMLAQALRDIAEAHGSAIELEESFY